MGKVLVTGGAGYIGSHTCVQLLKDGYDIAVIDNFDNSCPKALDRIKELSEKDFVFYEGDARDPEIVWRIFRENTIDCVIHFAGLKAVGESTQIPLEYYDNNINSTLTILKIMKESGVKNFLFSSSCTVYGNPHTVPITEDFPLSAASPYGMTKLTIERILTDLHMSDPTWNIALLRYFNPAGAHESGRMGEDPNGIPNNLVPYITQVAIGKREKLQVFGNDYPTSDGTGVRDYIHVMDLADGHLAAMKKVIKSSGLVAYNLGTGVGYSVLDIHRAFEKAVGRTIPYEIAARRPGDVAEAYSNPILAEKELGWKATRDLEDMARDAWNWQKNNPEGYKG